MAQRSGGRFTPRGRTEESVTEAEVQLEEQPRFTPRIRRPNRFKPKTVTALEEVELPTPAAPTQPPVQEQRPAPTASSRTRSRGSRTFAEAIQGGHVAGLRRDQIDILRSTGAIGREQTVRNTPARNVNTVAQRTSSRVSTRPLSSRKKQEDKPIAEPVQKTPKFNPPPFKPSSDKTQISPASEIKRTHFKVKNSMPKISAKLDEETSPISPLHIGKPSENTKEKSKRQRKLQIKKRTRVAGSGNKSKMMADHPTGKTMDGEKEMNKDIKIDTMEEKPKLDSNVMETLDETIKETSPKKVSIAEQMMKAEKSESIDAALEDSKLVSESTTTEQTTTSIQTTTTPTTTEAPTTAAPSPQSRRQSSRSRVRTQQPRTRTQATRTRGSEPRTGGAPSTPTPRLSGRRGGRGNSRGGAALVAAREGNRQTSTRSFNPRISSRNRVSPTVEESTADESQPPARRLDQRRRG